MILTLKIENFDLLPDGGPIEYQSRERNFEIGRDTCKDWTLPDPQRFISSHHCNVTFEKGAYWLHDLSTNGTFFASNNQRVASPYQLQQGDRLVIGHFIISVTLGENDDDLLNPFIRPSFSQSSNPASNSPDFSVGASDDPWAIDGPIPEPIDPKELMPPRKIDPRPSFHEQYIELPSLVGEMDRGEPAPLPQSHAPFGTSDSTSNGAYSSPDMRSPFSERDKEWGAPAPVNAPTAAELPDGRDVDVSQPSPESNQTPFSGDRTQEAEGYPSSQRNSHVPLAPSSGDLSDFLSAMAQAAGIKPEIFLEQDSRYLAQQIGAVLRVSTQEMSNLLKARTKAKLMAKSANRTMIGAMENNPLKFIPTPEECIGLMFSNRDRVYKNGEDSFREAFCDLQTHELATYSAMQKALGRLIQEFDPEVIEEKASKSKRAALGSKKARAWDVYQERWDLMNETNQNGILDVFLSYFSAAYDENVDKR
nr:type VI secretion system-associated FHA domain protein TagH [uncultured Cohaesibacter sp.]